MLNQSKIKSILDSVSGDGGPSLYKENLSILDISKDKVSTCEKYDIIIVNENFNNIELLDSILADNGKIISSYKDVKKVVYKFHKTQIFFWCEWIKSEKIIVFRRWRQPENKWLGQKSKANETLVVYSEHGWGDIFHKLRYLDKIKEVFAGEVFFEARKEIKTLLQENNINIIERESKFKSTYFFELCESDKLFGDMSNCQNYISAPIQEQIADIGIIWDSHHLTFENKSIDPDLFRSFHPDFTMLSIQKFTHQKHNLIPNFLIYKPIENWLDSAKLINSVKVIISVDTSVAHLSAAMGKPTNVLLNGVYKTPIDKNPSWYPSVTTWRQNHGWQKLFKQLIKHVEKQT